MESFFSRYKNALVLIVVLVAQLLALAVQVKRPAPSSPDQEGVSLIRYVVVSVITPPERLVHNIGMGIRGVWFGYLDLVHVRQQDAVLKSEIERLRLEQASLAEDAKQGQRLEELLSFRQHYIYKTVPAQVIGASGTDQSRTLYIDKGSKDGLAQDMPVVTADGIVGRLRDVFDHKSLVLLISDPTSGVGVILETTRTRGILKGVPFGQVQVINVSPDERIKAGASIVTSGGDQIFPRGLPVGTVERVAPDPDRDPLMDVAVKPAANLSQLEEVLVITNVGVTPSPQSAKDLAASEAEGEEEKQRASDVLAERLPGRLDPKAPADTNPDPAPAAGSVANADNVRLLTPPRPVRPDQYSPDATPEASEMTPGQRRGQVMQGTEDIYRSAPKKPSAAVAVNGAGTGSETPDPGEAAAVKRATPAPATASATGGTRTESAPSYSPSYSSSASRPGAAAARPGGENAAASASSRAPAPAPSSPPKTQVIVDGPMNSRPVEHPKPTVPAAAASAPVHKGPVLVPDDGSRPPAAMKPAKPKPVAPSGETSQPAPSAPPNGGR